MCIRARRPTSARTCWSWREHAGLLVCSGPKSIIDPMATAEKLEELGVSMIGAGVDRLPFFLARESPVELEHRFDRPEEAADDAARLAGARDLLHVACVQPRARRPARWIPLRSVPPWWRPRLVPTPPSIQGKERTPFLLAALAQITGGRSLDANLALLEDNARLAGEIAVAASAR